MTGQHGHIPEIPKPPRLEWQPIFGPAREIYKRSRDENIAALADLISNEVLDLYFPDLAKDDLEMREALVNRWATGLRNKFEEGIQEGLRMAGQSQLNGISTKEDKRDAFRDRAF